MLSLVAAITIPAAWDMPRELKAALAEADEQLAFAMPCSDDHPKFGFDEQLALRDKRLANAQEDAAQIWDPPREEFLDPDRPPRACTKAAVTAAIMQTDRALDTATARFTEATADLQSGVWLGPIKLCRANVVSADRGKESRFNYEMLSIRFTSSASALFKRISDSRINRRIAFRVDGKVVSSPTIFEPMLGSAFQIIDPDPDILDRARELISTDC